MACKVHSPCVRQIRDPGAGLVVVGVDSTIDLGPPAMKTLCAILLLLPLSVVAQVPASSNPMPAGGDGVVRDIVAHTLETNPEVQAAWDRFLAAVQAEGVARGEFLPTVDLTLRAGVGRQDFIDQMNELDFDTRGASLVLTQMLYDGWATQSETLQRREEARARYFDLMAQIETSSLEAITAYQDVLRFRGLVSLARDNLEQHERVLQQIRERVDAGVSRSADLDQATARLALAESNLITEQNNLYDVTARYQRIVGMAPPANLTPIESALDIRAPGTVAQALGAAYAENPNLLAAVSSILAAQQDLRRNKARYHPRVDLRLSGDYGEDIQRIRGRLTDTTAEVVMTLNVFNGLADRAAIAQARHGIDVAKDVRDIRCRNVRQTLRIAHNDLSRLSDQQRFLEIQKQSVDKARDAYLNQFRLGQRSLLDLLDTQNEFFETSRALLRNEVDLDVAQVRTLASMGQLARSLALVKSDVPDRQDWLSEELGPSLCPQTEAEAASYDIFDTDGDGVPDNRDACPGTPPGSVVDAVGCRRESLADTDGDGVPNRDDLCPNTPPGATVDASGCQIGQKVVLSGVYFDSDSATLKSDSSFILDPMVELLMNNPQTRIELSGHTDITGSTARNVQLSEARAASVKRYLVNQGVSPQQLSSKGWGPWKPVATNATIEGRAQNRRVEFRVLGPQE